MIEAIKDRWLLILVLFVFIIFKIPHLHYPFFWDESWSYEPGVKLMYLHGPSLMPNAIDTFYSRGHPLLFYAAAATWMRLFGDSHISQHAFSLFISVLLIISMYEVCNKLFNKRVAVLSTLIICVQVAFFVQASFVLPEIMVALLVLLTLYFYVLEKYILTFLFCTALLYTKESGVVLGLILGIHSFINLFNKQKLPQQRLKQFLPILCSGVAITGFFLLQKHLNGWFFFPGHIGMMTWEWGAFYGKVAGCLDFIYFRDYRSHLFLFFLTLSLAAAINFKNIRYAAPIIPAIVIYVIVQESFPFIPSKLLFAFLVVSFLVGAYLFVTSDEYSNSKQRTFIYLAFAFIVLYLCFCSVNFYTARYNIAGLIIVIILAAYYSEMLINRLLASLYYLALFGAVCIGLYGIVYDTGIGDTRVGAYDAMIVEENEVSYLENSGAYNSVIALGSFQNREHLIKPFTGFLHTTKIFTNVNWEINNSTQYVIFDNIEQDNRYDRIKNDTTFKMVYRTQKNEAWAEIYKRK